MSAYGSTFSGMHGLAPDVAVADGSGRVFAFPSRERTPDIGTDIITVVALEAARSAAELVAITTRALMGGLAERSV